MLNKKDCTVGTLSNFEGKKKNNKSDSLGNSTVIVIVLNKYIIAQPMYIIITYKSSFIFKDFILPSLLYLFI